MVYSLYFNSPFKLKMGKLTNLSLKYKENTIINYSVETK